MVHSGGSWDANMRPGELTRAEVMELRDLLRRMPRTDTIRGGAGQAIQSGPSGLRLGEMRQDGFFAKITSGSQPYAWTREVPATGGGHTDDPVTMTGTTTQNPAYALNGSTSISAGTIVWMWLWFYSGGTDGQNYAFVEAGSGGGGGGGGVNYYTDLLTTTSVPSGTLTSVKPLSLPSGWTFSGNSFVTPGNFNFHLIVIVNIVWDLNILGSRMVRVQQFLGSSKGQSVKAPDTTIFPHMQNVTAAFGVTGAGITHTIYVEQNSGVSLNVLESDLASVDVSSFALLWF